jgi:hypothetical protein
LPQSHGMPYIHCLVCCTSLSGLVVIRVLWTMFDFENCPDIEAISNASTFFRNTPYIWNDYWIVRYPVWRRKTVSPWLDGVNEKSRVSIKSQVLFYGLNFFFEIFLFLANNFGLTFWYFLMNLSNFSSHILIYDLI